MKGYWEQLLREGKQARRAKRPKMAKKRLLGSWRQAKTSGPRAQIEVLKPLGFLYYEKKEYKEALKHFYKLLKLLECHGTDQEREMILACVGVIHSRLRSLDKAEHYHKLALEAGKRSGNPIIQATCKTFLSTYAISQGRIEDALLLTEESIALMKLNPAKYFDEIRQSEELLVILYGQTGRKQERDLLRNRLVKKNIDTLLVAGESEQLEPFQIPEHWGKDRVSDFLEIAQRNTIASMALYDRSFEKIKEKDAQFRVMQSAITKFMVSRFKSKNACVDAEQLPLSSEDKLEVYFFQQTFSSFLGAVRLALSGQIAQAQMVLRGCLENAMYCVRVYFNPKLKAIWLNRNEDRLAVQNNFKVGDIWRDFDSVDDKTLGSRVHRLYDLTIDDGAHPNVNAFLQHSFHIDADGYITFGLNYLNPDGVESCIERIIEVADVCFEVFDWIFDQPARFEKP